MGELNMVILHIIITEHHEIASLPSGVRNDVYGNLNSWIIQVNEYIDIFYEWCRKIDVWLNPVYIDLKDIM